MPKRLYPEEIPFTFMGFEWKIKFINITGDCFGDSDTDSKEVRIYYKGRSKQNVLETLLHELMHVLVFDTSDSIFNYDHEKMDNKEENAIRLLSPRFFHLIKDNVKLIDFVVKEIKLL